MKKIYLFRLFLSFFPIFGFSQEVSVSVDYEYERQKWIDSVYKDLTLKERVAQLFIVAANSNADSDQTKKAFESVKDYRVGGICFFKGSPLSQVKVTNELQRLSKVPLMIATDAEWGLSMRLDSTFAYPWNMTLGALKRSEYIKKVGRRVGKHCHRMGIHINFAPDMDVNSNYKNPIIGNRSFGEIPKNVAEKGVAFSKGMQSEGVLACVKHFPGHGDTSQDSHKSLPIIPHGIKHLNNFDLKPFIRSIEEGVGMVMVGHLEVPKLDDSGFPSSLSKRIITGKLRDEYGFKGLICTDALDMKGVVDFKGVKDSGLAAFLAGSDIVLMATDVPKSIDAIVGACKKSHKIKKQLEASVKRILAAKYKFGLYRYEPVKSKHLSDDLNTVEDRVLFEDIAEKALTLVKNKNLTLPIKNPEKEKIAYLKFGDDKNETFFNTLNLYTKVDSLSRLWSEEKLLSNLKRYTKVIIGLHRSDAHPWKSYKMTSEELDLLQLVAGSKCDVILDVFTTPYSLIGVSLEKVKSVVVSYQNNDTFQSKSAQMIFGAITPEGQLPVGISKIYPAGAGLSFSTLKRLRYGLPESVGMDSRKLKKIDSIMAVAIKDGMTPGGQVLAARHGKVIFHKPYGYYTYDKKHPVDIFSIYDLASITKILAVLPEVMLLEENSKVDLNMKLKKLLHEVRWTNKAKISLLEMFSHYARLEPWIPFYKETITKDHKPMKEYYRKVPQNNFQIKVAESLYLRDSYQEKMFEEVVKSNLIPKREYKYSDLPFVFAKKIVQNIRGESIEKLVKRDFYQPLGSNYMTYRPLEKFPPDAIAPSEEDGYYRHQRLQGYVHDMSAAMNGGVGGNAGLFSNANDIAKVMQMYLQGGFYGGRRYFKSETIDRFNTCNFCDKNVRRGVIFDKVQRKGEPGPAYEGASAKSFGHSGFTGTLTWADPKNGLLYVFLSNRTYPGMDNRKLILENIRTKIHQTLYEAITDN